MTRNLANAHLHSHKIAKTMLTLNWVDILDRSRPSNRPNFLQRIAFDSSSAVLFTKWGDGAVIAYPNSSEALYLRCIEEKSGKCLRKIKDYRVIEKNDRTK